MRITPKDLEILKERAENPGKKLRDIAKKTNVSHVAVSKSIKKLEEANLIKQHLCLNLEKTSWVHGILKLDIVNANEFVNKRMKCPFIISFSKTNNEHNLVAEICAYSEEALQRFLDKCVRSDKAIRKLSFEEMKQKSPSFISIDFSKKIEQCEQCLKCEYYKNTCEGCSIDSFLKTLKI